MLVIIVEPKLAYLGQRNESECEIEHVIKSISPTKVEWNCRWKGEEYYGKNWDIEGAKFCRRIPECHRYYPKEKTVILRKLHKIFIFLL